MKIKQLYLVKFSNQNVNDLVMGEIEVYANTVEAALRKAAGIVIVPAGSYFVARQKVKPKETEKVA